MAQEQPSDEQYEDDEYEEEEGEEEEYEEEDGEEEGDESGAKATGKDVSGEAEGQGEGEAGEEEAEEGEEEEEEEEEEAQPWAGLARLPERASILPLLQELKEAGRKSVTILLLGKSGVGKSSTVNSFLREPAVRAQPFKLQADSETTTVVTRQVAAGVPEVDGLRVRLIDTCGLEDQEVGDTVNYAALQRIAEDIRSTPIDVVLYVDRLDLYRVEPLDKSIVQAVSDTFGPAIWKRAALVLTHANMTLTPPGTTYDSFAQRRVKALRAAVRSTCNPLLVRPALHALLVENSEACPTDAQGERVLPDGSPWLVGLAEEVVDVALAHRRPYKWHPRMQRKANNRLKWLLPFVVVGQWFLWQRVLLPLLKEDEAADDAHDDEVWRLRARERRRLGIGAPLKPSRDTLRRLELMYDEE